MQSIARSDLGGLFKARMDEGFTLLYANDSYYAIHGYTRGQLEQEMHGQAVGLGAPGGCGVGQRALAAGPGRKPGDRLL
ncbi:MAG: hypothetical protein ACLR1T_17775 [Evtepia gabavorous]